MSLENLPDLPRISDYLFFHAERTPDREFAVAGDRRITYEEMADRVAALSRTLLDLGVRPGDRVATLSTPRPEFMLAFLATVDIGAVWVGLNPKYQLRELRHVVGNSEPRVILGITSYRGNDLTEALRSLGEQDGVEHIASIDADVTGLGTLEELIERGRLLDDAPRLDAREAAGGKQPAALVYTSGTTGAPKGAMLTHRSLCWSFRRQAERWGVDPMRLICNLPINHSGCLGDIASTCLIAGGTLVLMEDFDPEGMLDLIEKEGINALMQVPTQYQVLVSDERFDSADLSSLEFVVWGGAAIARPVLDRLHERGLRTQVMYGMSESPSSLTFSRPDADAEQLTATIGKPDPEIEFRIADADGNECARGEAGEIQVRHDSNFAGYFGDPEATEAAFTADGFLKTGDQAVEREDGYIKLVGRLKEMYKSGGYNVYPREIEMTLERHPAVSAAVVVSIPDPLWSEIGCAFVVPRPGATAEVDDLRGWCRAELANYKVPKQITVLSELPLLPIGKPDKAALRKLAEAGDPGEAAGQPTREGEGDR